MHTYVAPNLPDKLRLMSYIRLLGFAVEHAGPPGSCAFATDMPGVHLYVLASSHGIDYWPTIITPHPAPN